jgi:hypothetical protein
MTWFRGLIRKPGWAIKHGADLRVEALAAIVVEHEGVIELDGGMLQAHGGSIYLDPTSVLALDAGAMVLMDGVALAATAAELNELADGSTTALHEHELAEGANDVTATAAQVNSLRHDPGSIASAVLRIAANVADGETVSIGDDTYEFDDDSAVTPGNIAVDVTGDLTPANATPALVAAINAEGTEAITAQTISNNQMFIFANAPGDVVLALAETMGGGDNEWDSATMYGGAAPSVRRVVVVRRVPNATEVELDRVLIPLDFSPVTSVIQVRVWVTTTGVPVAWTGSVVRRHVEQRVDLINLGGTDFSADHTIDVVIFE